jgi:hypothetical protein
MRNVGLPLCNLLLCAHPSATPSRQAHSRAQPHHPCPPRSNAIVPCFIVRETSSPMPASFGRHRPLLHRIPNAVASAHRAATSSRQAHSYAKRHQSCSPSRRAIASCPLACGMSSRMPISPQPDRAMPTRVRKGILNDAGSPTSACSGRRLAPARSWLF